MAESNPVELAERVARTARDLGIESVLIGAYAMAAHHYVRGTVDIDLATVVSLDDLERLRAAVVAAGMSAELRLPDDIDPIGGTLVVWVLADDDGDPIDPVEVVNFLNPFRPRRTPAADAIRNAVVLEGKPALRYPRLEDLIALKLYAGALRDHVDVVELLLRNPDMDLEAIRATSKHFGFDKIDDLIEQARREATNRR